MDLLVYKLEGANINKKVEIARIPVERSSLQHSFAMTRDYAIIFDPPWYMDMNFFNIIFFNGMLQDMIKNDVSGTTKVHVVRLRDGHVTTIDAHKWFLVLHFGNSYQIDDDTIVVEGPTYDNPEVNPFTIFSYD